MKKSTMKSIAKSAATGFYMASISLYLISLGMKLGRCVDEHNKKCIEELENRDKAIMKNTIKNV